MATSLSACTVDGTPPKYSRLFMINSAHDLVVALGAAVYLNWQFSGDNGFNTTGFLEPTKELGEAKYVNTSYVDDQGESTQANAKISDATKEATSITADFVKHGGSPVPETSSWRYIKKMGFDDGIFYPLEFGGSSSTGHRDQCYLEALTSGVRELLCFGNLSVAVTSAGMSFSDRHVGLSYRYWVLGSRLSPNGNRGEWA